MVRNYDWPAYFDKIFLEVKGKFDDEGAISPYILARRDAVNSLPIPVKTMELLVDTEKHKHAAAYFLKALLI